MALSLAQKIRSVGTFSGLAIRSDRMVRNPVRDIRSTQPTLVVNSVGNY